MKIYGKLVRKNKAVNRIQLPQFDFAHVFKNLEDVKDEENLEKCGDIIIKAYTQALKDLRNEDGSRSYNLIFTDEWLFMALRSKEVALEKFSINSMGFTGSFLVKDEKDLDELMSSNPLKILKEIGKLADIVRNGLSPNTCGSSNGLSSSLFLQQPLNKKQRKK